jgi:phospholipase D3/4
VFEVPGWEETKGSDALYPPFSRVNHAKYVVTDKRANIGTSNWTWDYFYQTAGASVNLTHEGIRHGLSQIFDRDWNSKYASELKATSKLVSF